MTLQDLKSSIEDGTFKPTPLILISEDKFIPLMYINEIVKSLKYSVRYVQSLSELVPQDEDIFGGTEVDSTDLVVYNVDTFDLSDKSLADVPNIIVIAKKIDKDAKKFYKDLIIEIPNLAEWQVRDMVYSFCKGVEPRYLDWLIKNCNGDVNRLHQESLKLRLFNEKDRGSLFQDMVADGAFDDLSSNTIFNFTNAILRKDIDSLRAVYEEIDNIDVNDFGLLTLLNNNFFNVISIQLGVNPTATSLGMKPNQFNAVKRNCGYYSGAQLVSIFRLLTDMDRRIKMGEFPTNIMRDYLILSILSQ